MAKYKSILTEHEINILNNLKNEYKIIEQTKLNMMSVLSYLIKYGANLQTGLRKSMKDTWNMYKRYHENIKSLSTFRDTIYKLKEANLISIIKKGKINIYFARNFIQSPSDNPSDNPSNENCPQTVDMTILDGDSSNTQILNINNNTITIIDNTVVPTEIKSKSEKSSAYEKAIEENNKDLVKPTELIKAAIDKLKEQGRRSKKIIARLETKLAKRNNINRTNMDKYLDVVVADAIAFYEVGREKMALLIATKKAKYNSTYNLKKNKYMVATANFTQRQYDYDKLEAQLLGWDISDDNYEIGTVEPTSTPITANFTQRQYDYDKLETQLLGWDISDDNYEIGTVEPTSTPITANFTQRQYDYDKLEAQLLGWDNNVE